MGRNEQAVCERIVTLLEERSGHRRADALRGVALLSVLVLAIPPSEGIERSQP